MRKIERERDRERERERERERQRERERERDMLGPYSPNHSKEHSLSPRFLKLKCNTISDWLNRIVVSFSYYRGFTIVV